MYFDTQNDEITLCLTPRDVEPVCMKGDRAITAMAQIAVAHLFLKNFKIVTTGDSYASNSNSLPMAGPAFGILLKVFAEKYSDQVNTDFLKACAEIDNADHSFGEIIDIAVNTAEYVIKSVTDSKFFVPNSLALVFGITGDTFRPFISFNKGHLTLNFDELLSYLKQDKLSCQEKEEQSELSKKQRFDATFQEDDEVYVTMSSDDNFYRANVPGIIVRRVTVGGEPAHDDYLVEVDLTVVGLPVKACAVFPAISLARIV